MILVTGGTGMLGSHLLPQLVLSGEKVRALIRESSDNRRLIDLWKYNFQPAEEIYNKIEWFRGDVTDMVSISEAMEGVEKVFHCAALVSFDSARKNEMYATNVIGTRNIVDQCLHHKVIKLLHVSSIAAIGPGIDEEILTEENRWLVNPKATYSLTKTLAEQEVWRGICEGLEAVIINPSIILGTGLHGQSGAQIFETVKKGLKFYTKGINGFVYVEDVVRAMIMLMEHEGSGERYIINAVNISFKELFEKIAFSMGVKPPSVYASPFLTSLAWKLIYVYSKLIGKPPMLTKESAQSAHKMQQYSSEKLMKLTGFEYSDIDESIFKIAGFYNK